MLLYRHPGEAKLIGESVVLYADNAGGRLTAVDLLSGEGWQVQDEGGEGPGEFGGRIPWFSESKGVIYTAKPRAQGASRSLDGQLAAAWRYPTFINDDPTTFPVLVKGILHGGSLATYFCERPDRRSSETQTLTQGVRSLSPSGTIEWTFTRLPPRVIRVVRVGDAFADSVISGDGVVTDARHATVIVGMDGMPWLVALNDDGTERARVELPYPLFDAFVDADERVWAQVWAKNTRGTGSYIVMDRNLRTIGKVTERNVQDAKGDYLLTLLRGELGVLEMTLLKKGV